MAAVKVDYYELLGVPPDADSKEIRRAFHAAARDVHPDVSDSTDAERHFRDLAEAYSVLSRPASRLLYDRFGYRGRGNSAVDEELWDVDRPGGPRGESIHVPIELRAFEASAGTSRLVRYEVSRRCSACEGLGTTGERDPDCPACGGSGRRRQVSDLGTARFLRMEPCPECGGDLCLECGGSGREFAERELKIHIPSELEDGAQLRVSGEGDVGDRGGVPGDLLLDVHVLPEPRDHGVLRLVSFVLFAAAIAILLVYVLLS